MSDRCPLGYLIGVLRYVVLHTLEEIKYPEQITKLGLADTALPHADDEN